MSKVTVYTAKKLDNLTTEKINEKIQAKESDNCEIEFVVNPSLIGGIVIQKNDVIFDGSVLNDLNNIKKYLSR